MKTFDLLGFAAHLGAIQRDMHELGPAIVRHGAEAIRDRARSYIGTYDAKPRWPELAKSTKKERAHKGYAENEPLLRTGEMRNSIEITISPNGLEAQIGSDNDKAVWHELGTSRAPPRPFLQPAAVEMAPKIQRAAGRATLAAMLGRGIASTEMKELFELLHLVKEVAHEVKEMVVDPVLEGDDKQHRQRR